MADEAWARHFEQAYGAGDHDYSNGRVWTETTAAVLALAGDVVGKSVLDAGCGLGSQAVALAAHGADVTAIDFDADQILRNGMTWPGVRWVAADLTVAASLPPTTFDLVTCVETLQTLDPGPVIRMLWERVAPKGRLVITAPNADSRPSRMIGDRRYAAVSAAWLREGCGRTLPGCIAWDVRGLHFATDRTFEVFDHRMVDELVDPPPFHVVACYVRG